GTGPRPQMRPRSTRTGDTQDRCDEHNPRRCWSAPTQLPAEFAIEVQTAPRSDSCASTHRLRLPTRLPLRRPSSARGRDSSPRYRPTIASFALRAWLLTPDPFVRVRREAATRERPITSLEP